MVVLTDGTIKLRQWTMGDAAALRRHADNRNVWKNLRDAFPHPYTLDDAVEWISAVSASETSLAIEVQNEVVGGIGLIVQDDVWRRSAEIGYWVGEDFWGRGIATAAVKMITGYGFDHLGLVRIFASVFAWNPASCRVLEKAGYLLEARRRLSVTKDGQTMDDFLYACTRETGRSTF